MSNTPVTLSYNNNSPTYSPNGPYTEHNGDSITVSISGFPGLNPFISEVTFFIYNTTNQIGQWNMNSPDPLIIKNGNTDVYSVSEGAVHGDVEITDIEANTTEDDYYFQVKVSTEDGGEGPWIADPEIINEGSD